MAILLDERVRAAVTRGRLGGQNVTLVLQTSYVRHGGARLAVDWGPPRRDGRQRVHRRIDDIDLVVEARIARYTYWWDLTISGWRLGPLDFLTVVREPVVLLDMLRWERNRTS